MVGKNYFDLHNWRQTFVNFRKISWFLFRNKFTAFQSLILWLIWTENLFHVQLFLYWLFFLNKSINRKIKIFSNKINDQQMLKISKRKAFMFYFDRKINFMCNYNFDENGCEQAKVINPSTNVAELEKLFFSSMHNVFKQMTCARDYGHQARNNTFNRKSN